MGLDFAAGTSADASSRNDGIAAAHVQFVNLVLVVGDVVGHFPVPVLGYNRTNGGGKLDTGIVQRTDVAGQLVAET